MYFVVTEQGVLQEIGLGVHRSSKRPNEWNAEQPEPKKKGYTKEEIHLIARLEAIGLHKGEEVTKKGVTQTIRIRFMNEYLLKRLPGRSKESLKSLRNRNQEYLRAISPG